MNMVDKGSSGGAASMMMRGDEEFLGFTGANQENQASLANGGTHTDEN